MVKRMSVPPMELVESNGPGTQKCAVMKDVEDIKIKRAKIPEPKEGEIRVKIKWVGICGSDLEVFRGDREPEFISYPTRLGHEVAGVIDKVGENVTGIREGDQVALRYVWGAFAEYVCCKPFSVKVLPQDFPLIEGSLIEVLPGVIHAAEIADISPNKDVLIMGQGVSGLILTQVISLFSPRNLVVTDLFEEKLALGKKYGATHTYKIPTPSTKTVDIIKDDFPDGFDIVVPALLEGDGMVDAIDVAAQNGKIVMYGCIGTCNQSIDFFKVHKKRLDIFSTEPKRDIDNRRYFDQSLQLVLDGLVNTKEMITDVFSLDQVADAFALRNEPKGDTLHVMIDCETIKE
ncbi:alcohol dehydrogenase catalytic domain-containing protein [Gracilibacillus salitolerans]|uniref:Alcohol dehydrogenase catalytic domain-containing protein n=1 Tax=Gracilibacillus salitolerans TaxID=2663022 RepID=A0A5Q2TNC9_9BACI|nr:alcohol dehydrogenase catalytic domain-containing protein [Gracilibacillus salitolerans]QGH35577.1 alcohol dehydrogenase catalytic domain-containing protein [Gracilibacillus salitolerans]